MMLISGHSPSRPKQTQASLEALDLEPGDTVFFKLVIRGDS